MFSRSCSFSLVLLAIISLSSPNSTIAETFKGGSEDPATPEISATAREALLKGEPVIDLTYGKDVKRLQVMGLLDAPLAEVRSIVQDLDNFAAWFPDQLESKLLSRDGNVSVMYGKTNLPWPLPNRTWETATRNYWVDYDGVPHFVAQWHYLGKGTMGDTYGYWMLRPWEGDANRTFLTYVNNSDLRVWAPEGMFRRNATNMLTAIINNLRDRHAKVFPTRDSSLP